MKFILPLKSFKDDFRASIVVFLVALPLAMGIAIASGYPPIAGLITGIIGGLVVGAISGAPLQVSGAAAGLTVIVFQGVQLFGIEKMGFVIFLAGIMQLMAGVGGIGRWFQAVSPTVLYGMLAGIGVLIVASQIYVMLDLVPKGNGLENLAAMPQALWSTIQGHNVNGIWALGLGVLTITLMIVWPKIAKGNLSLIPAPLVAILGASLVAFFASLPVQYISIPANLFETWSPGIFSLNVLWQSPELIIYALQLALIASAESLLCVAAVDQMHDGKRARYNQELAAQGIGNALCGLFGALPMTGVIVRSSANFQAGAKSRLSTMLHGAWILVFIVFLPNLLALIPTSALAGLLVYIGAKLVNLNSIRSLYHRGRSELLIYAIIVTVIFSYDLLLGVAIGLGLSGLKLLKTLSRLSVKTDFEHDQKRLVLDLRGAATFLRLPKLATTLENIPIDTKHVLVRLKGLYLIDDACREHFESWRRRFEYKGGKIEIEGNYVKN